MVAQWWWCLKGGRKDENRNEVLYKSTSVSVVSREVTVKEDCLFSYVRLVGIIGYTNVIVHLATLMCSVVEYTCSRSYRQLATTLES